MITFSSAFSIYQSKRHQIWYVDLNFYHQAKYCLFMGASADSGFLNLFCWQLSQAYENPSDDQAQEHMLRYSHDSLVWLTYLVWSAPQTNEPLRLISWIGEPVTRSLYCYYLTYKYFKHNHDCIMYLSFIHWNEIIGQTGLRKRKNSH